MTFLELYTELSDRGYAHLTTARLKALINRARARLDSLQDWSYLEDSEQGVAPLSIPTLKHVEIVSNETQEYRLEEVGYQDLINWNVDLDETGSPQCWYRATPAGDPVVATWPTSTDTVGVQFFAVAPDLSGDADEPLAPSRFHLLIVDLAQQMAERERGNYEASQTLQSEVDRGVNEMMEDLLPQNQPRYTRQTDASVDW